MCDDNNSVYSDDQLTDELDTFSSFGESSSIYSDDDDYEEEEYMSDDGNINWRLVPRLRPRRQHVVFHNAEHTIDWDTVFELKTLPHPFRDCVPVVEKEKESSDEETNTFHWNIENAVPVSTLEHVMKEQKIEQEKEEERIQKRREMEMQRQSRPVYRNERQRRPSLLTSRVKEPDKDGFRTVTYKKNKNTTASPPQLEHRNDLLCIYSEGHNHSCLLAHHYREWHPKTCKYGKRCSKGTKCSYWHPEIENKEQYLHRALRMDVIFFRKNKNQYLKTYNIRL